MTVNQTLSTIAVSPASVGLNAAATQQFTATANDQFGAADERPADVHLDDHGGDDQHGGLLTASEHVRSAAR